MSFWKSDEETAREDYERGQKDGSRANLVDIIVHDLPLIGTGGSEAYEKGWDNGLKNQPKD